MRIVSITAGAAGMYCGSCLRDNALASELLARGHDVTLMPVYTPTRTDEPNVSRRRVLFGGISVYLQQHAAFFRKTPAFVDRLWDSPRVIDAFAGRGVSTDARLLGELTVSMLQGSSGVLYKEFEKLVAWIRDEPRPDIINLPNSLLIAMAGPLRHEVKAPICCTLQGEELFLNGLSEPYRQQALDLIRKQVSQVDRFVAVSRYEADYMSELLAIPRARIAVVPLGIKMDGYERHQRSGESFTIGYFARVAPEKGLHVLADAFVRLRQRTGRLPVKLAAAGYLGPEHAGYLNGVRRMLESANLADDFSYAGEVDRKDKIAFLRGLDVLSVPATYDDPKGMFLLEAMASGVPVVQPKRGGFTEIVETTGGGLLVEPDSPESLAEGLHALWSDRSRARSLGARAFEGVRASYSIVHSASSLIEAYTAVLQATPSRESVA